MEIQGINIESIYRGEVESITLDESAIRVKFKWLAILKGFPPKWTANGELAYKVRLDYYDVRNVGPSAGKVGGGNRLFMQSPIMDDVVVLYPPDGSKIDPDDVKRVLRPELNKFSS